MGILSLVVDFLAPANMSRIQSKMRAHFRASSLHLLDDNHSTTTTATMLPQVFSQCLAIDDADAAFHALLPTGGGTAFLQYSI